MNAPSLSARLAVCSWSLQPTSPQELIAAVKATGLNRVQLDLDPLLRESPEVWGSTQALLAEAGIEVVSGMFRTVGEDYTTMETIRVTGGVAPDATWEQNKANIAATVPIAKQLGHGGSARSTPALPAALDEMPSDPDVRARALVRSRLTKWASRETRRSQ